MCLLAEVLAVVVESIVFFFGVGDRCACAEMRFLDPFVEDELKVILFVRIPQKGF